jgi:MerR family transcriptional regulator/heat shock protein HspR
MPADKDDVRAVYVISVAAELVGVHPQTLRNYERSGLLDPSRSPGGSRRFSEADLARLRRIQELTAEGVNLEGVKRILALEAEIAELRERLGQLVGESAAEVAAAHRQYRRDLVPMSNSIAVLFESAPRARGER